MINSNFFLGLPVSFQNLCQVYPPKIKDILNSKDYPVYRKILLSSQEDIEDDFADKGLSMEEIPTPFGQIFLLSGQDERLKKVILDAFEFFIHEPVTLLSEQKLILIGDLAQILPQIKSIEELRIIKEDNFFDFQNLLRQSIGEKDIEPYNSNEHPKVKYFKAKARLRDRVKATSKNSLSLGASLASICCMGFGLNPLNVGELSQSALAILMRYYQEKTKYDIDIQSLLAGADSKKVKPQNWIRNIDDL